MITVYIALRGESHEGAEILGVYLEEENAKARCSEEEKAADFARCDYTKIQQWDVGDSEGWIASEYVDD